MIEPGTGINSIDGGTGFDTLVNADFSTNTAALAINNLSNSFVLSDGNTVNNIEKFTGLRTGSGADTITFTTRANDSLSTNGGNDTINAGLGYDEVDGGDGTDLLIVDYSSNTYADPGAGINSYLYNPTETGLRGYILAYYNSTNSDQVYFTNIERLQITGTGSNDQIITGSGDDTIDAGGGDDVIDAGEGDEMLFREGMEMTQSMEVWATILSSSVETMQITKSLHLGLLTVAMAHQREQKAYRE